MRKKTSRLWFDLFVLYLSYRWNERDLRKGYASWYSFTGLLVYLEYLSAEERECMHRNSRLAKYVEMRTRIERYAGTPAARRESIMNEGKILCMPIPKSGTWVSSRRGLLVNSRYYLTRAGMAYASKIRKRYSTLLNPQMVSAALRDMYPEDSSRPPRYILKNLRKGIAGKLEEAA